MLNDRADATLAHAVVDRYGPRPRGRRWGGCARLHRWPPADDITVLALRATDLAGRAQW